MESTIQEMLEHMASDANSVLLKWDPDTELWTCVYVRGKARIVGTSDESPTEAVRACDAELYKFDKDR